MKRERNISFLPTIGRFPVAIAKIKGSNWFPDIMGKVSFFKMENGTFVFAQVDGLPDINTRDTVIKDELNPCFLNPVFGFQVHSGSSCTGTGQNPFANAGLHYNPLECEHPHHAGDMPPLFGNRGYALSAFFTERFHPRDIIGHTVIIHANPDDFTTQPSGNSGDILACGEIVENYSKST
ncbi:MAG: superoxide dismutase family protein [Eubacterium sp.]|jgi:Cu-Zn family superoxide dismutase|nr:superoxide dismutase family protein [Eubacterium sp.]